MNDMKQKYTVIVLFALILMSSLTSVDSYRSTSRMVNEDMDRALTLTMLEQQSDIISPDTIRKFNSHLQIAELRGKATLAVELLRSHYLQPVRPASGSHPVGVDRLLGNVYFIPQ